MPSAIEQIYDQLLQVLGGSNPNQLFCMTIPGTILDEKSFFYDLTKEKPHLVTEAESRLVDQMFDLAQITGSSNGQRVSNQYLTALRLLMPKFDPMMPIVKNQLRTYLNSPAPSDASVNDIPFVGNLEQYYFALYEDWLAKKSAWDKQCIAQEKALTPEDYLEWFEGNAEGELAIIDAAMGRLLCVFSPSDMDAVLGALAAGVGGQIEEAANQVIDYRLPSPSGGYIYPVDLTPADWFLDLLSDENPQNLLNDPQFIAIAIASKRQAIQASIGQIQNLLNQVPSGADLQNKTAQLAQAQSDYTAAQTALLSTYADNTATAVEMYLTDGAAGGSGSDDDALAAINKNAVDISKAKGESPVATGATKKGGLPISVDDVKQLLDGQKKLIGAQAALLSAAQNVANMGMNLVAAQAQTFAGLPIIIGRLESQLTDLQSVQSQLTASAANSNTDSGSLPAIHVTQDVLVSTQNINITGNTPLEVIDSLVRQPGISNAYTPVYVNAMVKWYQLTSDAFCTSVNTFGSGLTSIKSAADAVISNVKNPMFTDVVSAVIKNISIQSLKVNTSADQVAGSLNLLNFSDVTGIHVGMCCANDDLAANTVVSSIDVTNKTVVLSADSKTQITNGASIYFYSPTHIVRTTTAAAATKDTLLKLKDVTGLQVGFICVNSGIATGTTIVAIDTTNSSVTISNPLIGAISSDDFIEFSGNSDNQLPLTDLLDDLSRLGFTESTPAPTVVSAIKQYCDQLWSDLKVVTDEAQKTTAAEISSVSSATIPSSAPTTLTNPVVTAIAAKLNAGTTFDTSIKNYFYDATNMVLYAFPDSMAVSAMIAEMQNTISRFSLKSAPKVTPAGTSDRYMSFEFSFSSDEMDQSSSQSSMSASTDWSVSLFFGSASGSNSSSSSLNSSNALENNTEIKIGFKATKVDIARGWFDPGVFKLTTDMNRISTVIVSNGVVDFSGYKAAQDAMSAAQDSLDQAKIADKAQSTPATQKAIADANANIADANKAYSKLTGDIKSANEAIFPCFPVSFIIAKDVNIQFQASRSQMDAVKSVLDSHSAVGGGFLCFSASSASAAHSDSSSVVTKTQDTVVNICIPGPQILGWYLECTPKDHSDHIQVGPTPPGYDINIMEFVAALNKLS